MNPILLLINNPRTRFAGEASGALGMNPGLPIPYPKVVPFTRGINRVIITNRRRRGRQLIEADQKTILPDTKLI
jgi:hypothetical protein